MKPLRLIPIAIFMATLIRGLGLMPTFTPSASIARAQEQESSRYRNRDPKRWARNIKAQTLRTRRRRIQKRGRVRRRPRDNQDGFALSHKIRRLSFNPDGNTAQFFELPLSHEYPILLRSWYGPNDAPKRKKKSSRQRGVRRQRDYDQSPIHAKTFS